MKSALLLLSIILAVALARAAIQSPTMVKPENETCTPEFPFQDGWLGGDNIYSVPLSKNRSLWLFGDSFVRNDGLSKREGAQMVSNSLALSSCETGHWKIRYHWRKAETSSPEAFFPAQKGFDKLWPKDGFVLNGALYLFFDEIRNKPGGSIFGFEGVGTQLVKIANPAAEPESWKIETFPLTQSNLIFPAVSVAIDEPFAYLFSVLDDEKHKDHPIILLRLPLQNLAKADQARNLELLTKQGVWSHDLNYENAKTVIPDGATEMTVRYHGKGKFGRWVAVQIGPGFPPSGIATRQSTALEGPWSAPEIVFRFPETDPQQRGFDRDTFCYAAKEHDEFPSQEAPETLLVTYACNSFQLKKLVLDLGLYRPQTVRVPISAKPRSPF